MKWSWKLGRVFGIDIFMHATFVLLLAWVALSAYLRDRDAHAMVVGVAFMLAFFGSVLLHELGHALTAKRFGIRTRDITLLPIGGVARLERMPENPRQELLVALAGPAVNVVIAGALFLVLSTAGQPVVLDGANVLAGTAPFFTRLLYVNVTLAIFNLIPAFPMDGGRALRAVLAFSGDYVKATQVAAKLGQGIALLFGVLGLLFNPLLAFIALFVWIGAGAEAAGVEAKASLQGLPMVAAMQTDFRTLSTHDTIGTAARRLLGGSQVDFPVLDPTGALVGVLTRGDLIAGLAEHGSEAVVASVMDRRFVTAHPAEMLIVAMARLQECACRSIPIVAEGRVVGMVTTDNIGELMMVRDALGASLRKHPTLKAA
jgi:Zn-dependent protease/CBS domain-containing protein